MLYSDLFDPTPSEDTPIACDLSALDDPGQHGAHFKALFEEREELRKAPGGLAVRFPGTMNYAERLLTFVGRERQCCPFLTFGITVEPEERGIWLYMGGDDQVEEYITTAFDEQWSK